ncbi:hypothetical protein HK097_003926, partial [Rhizophlyctis rosea]
WEKTFPPELRDFHKVLTGRLAPLKVCSREICIEFDKIATHLEIFNYYHYVDTARPPLSRQSSTSTFYDPSTPTDTALPDPSSSASTTRLDDFFPFDPLPLPLSKSFIQDLYNEWKGLGDEEEEEDESLREGSVDVPMRLGMGDLEGRFQVAASLEDGMSLGSSFGGMSVSPGPYGRI